MARKLKTYQTSLGFFDLAIAAPSMKAALEAWGADSNLFHQGAANESRDPDVVAATMAKPGVVLRRSVGSVGSFGEHADLPTDLGAGARAATADRKSGGREAKKPPSRPIDKAAQRKAALVYEREQSRRRREQAREQAATRKEQDRLQRAVDKAQAAFERAEQEHAKRAAVIQAEADAIEKRSQAEDARWKEENERLGAALRRGSPGRRVVRDLPERSNPGHRADARRGGGASKDNA